MIPLQCLLARITLPALLVLATTGCGDGTVESARSDRLDRSIVIEWNGSDRFTATFDTMGTLARIVVVATDEPHARRAIERAAGAVRSVAASMSTYRPESEISILNRNGANAEIPLSENVVHVLERSVQFCELTGGAFDVTYAPLRSLWRRAEERGVTPTDEEISAVRARVGSKLMRLSRSSCLFGTPGMAVDLGGIAKGFAIDLACEALRAEGIDGALVDIGGDMRTLGRRPGGEAWKVLVNDPTPGENPPLILLLADRAVATSGDYQRFFTIDGQRFSHIVDPRTGRPVESIPSATVIARDALTADALATAISVLGPGAARPLIESLDGAECLILSTREASGPRIVKSSGFDAFCQAR